MGRHDQQKGAVLSPRAVEGAKKVHFKTLFQDPSLSQVRTNTKGLKQVPFKTPNVKIEHTYGKNDQHQSKSSSFQDHHPQQQLQK